MNISVNQPSILSSHTYTGSTSDNRVILTFGGI